MFRLRRPVPADHDALGDICVRTGDAGGDASALYPEPRLLADIFLLPYLRVEPDWCWLAEDDAGVAGYLVATPDTASFAERTEARWWPSLRRLHPLPDADDERPGARLVRRLHAGVLTGMPFLDSHPAHLHVDLLPRAQGQGLGGRLMGTLTDSLRAAGVPGVHLAVAERNSRAIRFYERCGFEELERAAWGRWMGRELS